MRQALAHIPKVIAGLAGVVFLLAPLTDTGVIVTVVALVVAIITAVASSHLSDDEGSSGYWPKDPNHSP